jgi:cardiolipin synthase
MAPTWLSKVNTALEFAALAAVLAQAAGFLDARAWLPALFVMVFATVILSGVQYVWAWSRKAAAARRAA